MSHSQATLRSFGEFLGTDSGIVSLVSLAATVVLGGIALWIARRYQLSNSYVVEQNHNELVQRVIELAAVLSGTAAPEAPSAPRVPIDATRDGRVEPEQPGMTWRSGAFVAADVRGTGTLDLVTQHRTAACTTLRLFRIDDRLKPSLLGSLETGGNRRFAVSDGSPATVATHDETGEAVAYRWAGEAFVRTSDAGRLDEVPPTLTNWPEH